MSRILFVDDEEMILKGLRRMLFASRDKWGVSFANSGERALEELEKSSYDVIVSDMRMPGMNGNQLLAEVQRRHPSVVRVILSGHADRELILESTRYAHQYLSKPCEEGELKSTLERCCHVRSLLQEESLVQLVSSLTTIPSLPVLYTELLEVVGSNSWTLRDVGAVIAKDIGMTAKVLQLVNSPFFGLTRHIADAEDAVSYLGIDTIKALVLSVKVFSQFDQETIGGLSVERIARHDMNTGMLARLIATAEGAPEPTVDHAFLAGTLHDAGRLILAANRPKAYAEVLSLVKGEGLETCEAELKVIGSTHAQVAAYLLSIWALPQPIVEAVAHHHAPSECPADSFTPLTAVHVANALDSMAEPGGDRGDEPHGLDRAYLERIGLLHRLPVWREACRAATEQEVR